MSKSPSSAQSTSNVHSPLHPRTPTPLFPLLPLMAAQLTTPHDHFFCSRSPILTRNNHFPNPVSSSIFVTTISFVPLIFPNRLFVRHDVVILRGLTESVAAERWLEIWAHGTTLGIAILPSLTGAPHTAKSWHRADETRLAGRRQPCDSISSRCPRRD